MKVEDARELISAALDGEEVDLELLQDVLAESGSRDALAAFVLLRAVAAADRCAAEPAHSFVIDTLPESRRTAWWVLNRRVAAYIAASLGVMALAGSLWLGTARRGQPTPSPAVPGSYQSVRTSPALQQRDGAGSPVLTEQPPVPARRVHFTAREWQGS